MLGEAALGEVALAENAGEPTSVTDTGCNFLLEDGGLLAQEDGSSGFLGENCFLPNITDTGCNLLLEDGSLFVLEDGSGGILGENCFQSGAVTPTFATRTCRILLEDGSVLLLEDGSAFLLEQCGGGGWVGKPRRPAKRWWELIREEREAIRNAERLKDEPLQEAVDDVVEIVEEQRGLTGQRLLDATQALKQAAAAKTRQEAAAAVRQLEAVVRAVRLYQAEQDEEDIALLLLMS